MHNMGLDAPGTRALAAHAAEHGAVLLRNQGDLLPLRDNEAVALLAEPAVARAAPRPFLFALEADKHDYAIPPRPRSRPFSTPAGRGAGAGWGPGSRKGV